VIRSRSLPITIILQFAVIIVPLTALLALQAALDARRASEANQSLQCGRIARGRRQRGWIPSCATGIDT
jgi:hypothetical protein